MATSAGMERSVKEIIAKVLKKPIDAIRLESRLREDLCADSLDLAFLLYEMEDRLEIKVNERDAKAIQTVADAVKLAGEVAPAS